MQLLLLFCAIFSIVCGETFNPVTSTINEDHLHPLLDHLRFANRECVERKISLSQNQQADVGEIEAYMLILAALEYCVEELIDRQIEIIVKTVENEDDNDDVECNDSLLDNKATGECAKKFEASFARLMDELRKTFGDVQQSSCGTIEQDDMRIFFLKMRSAHAIVKDTSVSDDERRDLRDDVGSKAGKLLICLLGKIQNFME
jgi:hypothetical protein